LDQTVETLNWWHPMELWRFLRVEEKAEPEWELQIQFQHVAEHSYPVV